jgi:hypothetical protein
MLRSPVIDDKAHPCWRFSGDSAFPWSCPCGLTLLVSSNYRVSMSKFRKPHKAFLIQATAIPFGDTMNHFTVHISSRSEMGNHPNEALFESGEIFSTESAALDAGFRMGKQKIDAGFQPRTVVTPAEESVEVQD